MKNLLTSAVVTAILAFASSAHAEYICYFQQGYQGSPYVAYYEVNYCKDDGSLIYSCYGLEDTTGAYQFPTSAADFKSDKDIAAAVALRSNSIHASVWTDGYIAQWGNAYHCGGIGFWG